MKSFLKNLLALTGLVSIITVLAVAAVLTGRIAYTAEIDEEFQNLALGRLAEAEEEYDTKNANDTMTLTVSPIRNTIWEIPRKWRSGIPNVWEGTPQWFFPQ